MKTVDKQERVRTWFHPLRIKIVDLLRKHGPMTQTEVARAIDAAPASARYHLMRLLRARFVEFAGTRPGPKGITEKLFQHMLPAADEEPLTIATRHGSKLDDEMRKLNFDQVAEAHRVAERITRRNSERFFGIKTHEIEASPEKLRALRDALDHTVRSFLAGLQPPGEDAEKVTLCINFYPQKQD